VSAVLVPSDEAEAAAAIGDAMAAGRRLRLAGGGTRAGFGRPVEADDVLSTAGLDGILLLEPAELIVSARAGTPVATVAAALSDKGQMLPFEPVDLRAVYGTQGEPTIGGLVAGNWSGPRRIVAGALRDHVIGVRFVNGRGDAVKSGGRVMKNVTGLDLAKLMCGAHGTLGLITEVTFKVLPLPRRSVTLAFPGLDDNRAVQALAAALGSPFSVSGAAHLPAGVGGAEARTLLRLEGFPLSVDHRVAALLHLLAAFGQADTMEGEAATRLWAEIRDGVPLAAPRTQALWRLSVAPTRGPSLAGLVGRSIAGRCYYDWGGGLIWLSTAAEGDAGAGAIREALVVTGGHATLIRAPEALRRTLDVLQPLGAPLAAITGRIKASFDPAGILNPGRMYAAA
jgi:glycolate oxidase FAD binding subunit